MIKEPMTTNNNKAPNKISNILFKSIVNLFQHSRRPMSIRINIFKIFVYFKKQYVYKNEESNYDPFKNIIHKWIITY